MVPDLVQRLEDDKPKVRAEAAADLVELCRTDADARERFGMRFLTLLNDESPAVRGHAVVGTVICDESLSHVDRVLRLLDDPSPGVRLQVIHVMGPLGLPEVLPALTSRLEDEDIHVRTSAAAALSFAGDPSGIPVLLGSLEKRGTREEAMHALRQVATLGDTRAIAQAVGKLFGAFFVSRFERVAAAGVLAVLGDTEARAHLVDRVGRKGIDRPLAIELVGELRIAEAEELVRASAANATDPLRGTALRALASLGTADALERCSKVLLDESEDVDARSDAAEGLLLLGGAEAEAVLERARASVTEPRVRSVVESALSLFGKPPREIRLYLPLSGEELHE